MRLLSFDTSSETLQLALLQGDSVVLEQNLTPSQFGVDEIVSPPALEITEQAKKSPSPRIKKKPPAPARQEAAGALMPAIAAALRQVGWKKEELDCIVVGNGPGGFTSIRTAVVTARTLAQALDLPLLAVSRLECLATVSQLPAAIVLSASRGHFFVAGFAPVPGSLLTNETSAACYMAGEQIGEHLKDWSRRYGDQAAVESLDLASLELEPLPEVKNYATKQGQIAWNRLSLTLHKEASAKHHLRAEFPYRLVQPLYLRGPSITLKPLPEAPNGNQNPADAPGRH